MVKLQLLHHPDNNLAARLKLCPSPLRLCLTVKTTDRQHDAMWNFKDEDQGVLATKRRGKERFIGLCIKSKSSFIFIL